MTPNFSDAELRAFLNGTLVNEAQNDTIEAELNTNPALAARIEALALASDEPDETAAAIRAAFAPIMVAPVPEALARIVAPVPAGAEVVDLAAARARRALPAPANDTGRGSWRWPQLGAMAASLVLGLILGGPLLTGGSGGDASAPGASLVLASAEVGAMLDRAPSGERVDLAALGTGEVVLTFRDTEGRLCRQFLLEASNGTSDALACAGGAGGASWQVEAYGRRAAPAGEMKLAGGDAAPAVVAAVDAVIASDPVVGADELAELGKR